VDVSHCSPDLDLGAGRRTGLGPRRRACSDIRTYMAERAGNHNKRSTNKISKNVNKYNINVKNWFWHCSMKSDYFNLRTYENINFFSCKLQKH
jgi:hypothetical protein